MYENFVGTWETVRNREVSVLERCPHGEMTVSTIDKHVLIRRNFWQSLKKFVGGVQSHLNFKFKVALNATYRIFLNFAKSCTYSCLSNVDNIKKFHCAILEI